MDVDRIEQLKALRKSRLLEAALGGLPSHMQKARIDCLIYFQATQFIGWREKFLGEDGTRFTGIFGEQRLGFPTFGRITAAIHRVRAICPEEARAYQQAFRRFREARRRFLASETEAAWLEYRYGWRPDGTRRKNTVAYVSYIEKWRGENTYFKFGYFRYRIYELMPTRVQERRRARRHIKTALREMGECREAIFERMEVPEPFRRLI